MTAKLAKSIMALAVVLCALVLFKMFHEGQNQTTMVAKDGPVQIAIASMTNEYEEIGWRTMLGHEYEPVSGQYFIFFSINGDTNDISTFRKAIRAWPAEGGILSLARGVKGQRDDVLEVYVVQMNHRDPKGMLYHDYITMRDAPHLRVNK